MKQTITKLRGIFLLFAALLMSAIGMDAKVIYVYYDGLGESSSDVKLFGWDGGSSENNYGTVVSESPQVKKFDIGNCSWFNVWGKSEKIIGDTGVNGNTYFIAKGNEAAGTAVSLPTNVYIFGNLEGQNWAYDKFTQMDTSSNPFVFTKDVTTDGANKAIGFSAYTGVNWDNVHNNYYEPSDYSNGRDLTSGVARTFKNSYTLNNDSFNVPEQGEWTITMDFGKSTITAVKKDTPTPTPTVPDKLYFFKGVKNSGWNPTSSNATEMDVNNGVFTKEITTTSNYESIGLSTVYAANNDGGGRNYVTESDKWYEPSNFSNDKILKNNESRSFKSGYTAGSHYFEIESVGTYTLTVNFNDKTIKAEKVTDPTPTVPDKLSIIGTAVGASWDNYNEDGKMTLQSEGIYYTRVRLDGEGNKNNWFGFRDGSTRYGRTDSDNQNASVAGGATFKKDGYDGFYVPYYNGFWDVTVDFNTMKVKAVRVSTASTEYTVYFDKNKGENSQSWSNVYAYVTDGSGNEQAGPWPGTAMTEEKGLYSYTTAKITTVPGGSWKVVFNSGIDEASAEEYVTKTPELDWISNHTYSMVTVHYTVFFDNTNMQWPNVGVQFNPINDGTPSRDMQMVKKSDNIWSYEFTYVEGSDEAVPTTVMFYNVSDKKIGKNDVSKTRTAYFPFENGKTYVGYKNGKDNDGRDRFFIVGSLNDWQANRDYQEGVYNCKYELKWNGTESVYECTLDKLYGQFQILTNSWGDYHFGQSYNKDGYIDNRLKNNVEFGVTSENDGTLSNLLLDHGYYENVTITLDNTNKKVKISGTPRDVYVYYWNDNVADDSGKESTMKIAQLKQNTPNGVNYKASDAMLTGVNAWNDIDISTQEKIDALAYMNSDQKEALKETKAKYGLNKIWQATVPPSYVMPYSGDKTEKDENKLSYLMMFYFDGTKDNWIDPKQPNYVAQTGADMYFINSEAFAPAIFFDYQGYDNNGNYSYIHKNDTGSDIEKVGYYVVGRDANNVPRFKVDPSVSGNHVDSEEVKLNNDYGLTKYWDRALFIPMEFNMDEIGEVDQTKINWTSFVNGKPVGSSKHHAVAKASASGKPMKESGTPKMFDKIEKISTEHHNLHALVMVQYNTVNGTSTADKVRFYPNGLTTTDDTHAASPVILPEYSQTTEKNVTYKIDPAMLTSATQISASSHKFISGVADMPTGIEDILEPGENELDSTAEPVYFNLQGLRVSRPVKGQIYIKVAGNQSEKILF